MLDLTIPFRSLFSFLGVSEFDFNGKKLFRFLIDLMNVMQGACVQNVLDSLVPALLADKNRKFIYVEQVSVARY